MTYAPHIVVVPANVEHAMELATTLRAEDREEVVAQCGMHPAVGLGASLGCSDRAWAGLVDGRVACIFGVAAADEMDSTVGVPWLLGSDLIEKHQRAFLRRNRPVIAEMIWMFPVLENYVDVRNTASIRWLRWLGFDIIATVPHGPYNLLFHHFRMTRA